MIGVPQRLFTNRLFIKVESSKFGAYIFTSTSGFCDNMPTIAHALILKLDGHVSMAWLRGWVSRTNVMPVFQVGKYFWLDSP